MKSKFLCVMLAAGMFIIQSCSKTEYAPTPNVAAADPIANSTGLMLDGTGNAGVYQMLTGAGQASQISNNSKAVGGTANVADYAGTPFQKWKVSKVVGGYTFMNVGSGLYLQSYNYNGTQVIIQNTANGGDSQLWNLSPLSPKTGKIISKSSGLAVTTNGTGMIQLKPYSGLSTQVWGYNQLPGDDTLKAKTFYVSTILQSNMVIQRDKPFNVWGRATPNFRVSVKASWNPGLFTAVSDASGNWIATIPSAPVNATPQTLTASVSGQVPVTFNNILIGDVWICSGQSNMEMTVDSTSAGLFYSGITNYKAEIAAANFPLIREVTVGADGHKVKLDTLTHSLKWTVCSPATVGPYSAVAYFFARQVQIATHIPIGIVVSCYGGTYAQQWTSKETIAADPVLAGYYKFVSNSAYYNGMIYPLRNLSIKGFTWYQGESNRDDVPLSNYTRLTSAMIGNWRTLFNQGELPFYYVQVTPYARDYFSTSPWGGDPLADDYAFFREAQSAIKAVTPNTGQAITMDVGDLVRIHPYNKRPVGERLGLLALKGTYGQSVQTLGPQYLSWSTTGSTATISFVAGTATGLNTINNAKLKQFFFVAGTDHVFRQATAVISGEQMVVTAPAATPLPIQAVRYAFTDFPITNLQNSSGLPMEAFRTDNWTN